MTVILLIVYAEGDLCTFLASFTSVSNKVASCPAFAFFCSVLMSALVKTCKTATRHITLYSHEKE